jgi:hypothetical protein
MPTVMSLNVTLSINYTEQNETQHNEDNCDTQHKRHECLYVITFFVMLSVVMLSVVMLSVVMPSAVILSVVARLAQSGTDISGAPYWTPCLHHKYSTRGG